MRMWTWASPFSACSFGDTWKRSTEESRRQRSLADTPIILKCLTWESVLWCVTEVFAEIWWQASAAVTSFLLHFNNAKQAEYSLFLEKFRSTISIRALLKYLGMERRGDFILGCFLTKIKHLASNPFQLPLCPHWTRHTIFRLEDPSNPHSLDSAASWEHISTFHVLIVP